jgi:hypothetical protein
MTNIVCEYSDYINNNEFVTHPMGNYALYGLNNLGCNSVILYNNEILKFYAFKCGSNDAIYINKDGNIIVIDPYDKSLNIVRMIDKKEATTYVEC